MVRITTAFVIVLGIIWKMLYGGFFRVFSLYTYIIISDYVEIVTFLRMIFVISQ